VANFPAITHVALTVTDLDRSAVWYERLLGVEPVLDEDAGGFHHKVYPSGGMLLGLHLHPGGDNAEQFRVTRPGMDHVAFGCASRDELTEWQARLDELGIAHDGIIDAAYGSGLSFKDPDGTALEFFARMSASVTHYRPCGCRTRATQVFGHHTVGERQCCSSFSLPPISTCLPRASSSAASRASSS